MSKATGFPIKDAQLLRYEKFNLPFHHRVNQEYFSVLRNGRLLENPWSENYKSVRWISTEWASGDEVVGKERTSYQSIHTIQPY